MPHASARRKPPAGVGRRRRLRSAADTGQSYRVASAYRRVAALKTAERFAEHLDRLGIAEQLPFAAGDPAAPLAEPLTLPDGRTVGNRFCVQPMEGWDGAADGRPSALVERRWRAFGRSGAKLIWGGEAVAVEHAGRANPNQLRMGEDTIDGLAALRGALIDEHRQRYGAGDDLLVGLQLTHSGRFCRPADSGRAEPWIPARHPVLDRRFGIAPDHPLATDEEIEALVERFIASGALAAQAGFDFVDVKHCHGYFAHELLGCRDRPGRFGGDMEHRTRFLREVVAGLRRRAPGLLIGVRLSAFDAVPFRPSAGDGTGEPTPVALPYRAGFGVSRDDPAAIDLTETVAFLELLQRLDVPLVNVTAGSPYYTPHLQRPALFPPSDGYRPPEDPLVGVARQIDVVRRLKRRFPGLIFVGSAYSYLQEWLPAVAAEVVRRGHADAVGLGRMMLSYPDLPHDVLAGLPLARKRICRTFSDCTTAPRKGLISGCFPLDPFYRDRPEAQRLQALKSAADRP